uniref:Uncharacterized protein n=1 Tax=Arundo donax TaxID=35708 RepID=A0A0A9HUU2_ARUDO
MRRRPDLHNATSTPSCCLRARGSHAHSSKQRSIRPGGEQCRRKLTPCSETRHGSSSIYLLDTALSPSNGCLS